jgi:hypothetical protein
MLVPIADFHLQDLICFLIPMNPDPYVPPTLPDSRIDKKHPKSSFWIPILIGIAVTPITITVAVLSSGLGHGSGDGELVLYPLRTYVQLLAGDQTLGEYIIYLIQFPIYGVIAALFSRKLALPKVFIGLIIFHSLCVLSQVV